MFGVNKTSNKVSSIIFMTVILLKTIGGYLKLVVLAPKRSAYIKLKPPIIVNLSENAAEQFDIPYIV